MPDALLLAVVEAPGLPVVEVLTVLLPVELPVCVADEAPVELPPGALTVAAAAYRSVEAKVLQLDEAGVLQASMGSIHVRYKDWDSIYLDGGQGHNGGGLLVGRDNTVSAGVDTNGVHVVTVADLEDVGSVLNIQQSDNAKFST